MTAPFPQEKSFQHLACRAVPHMSQSQICTPKHNEVLGVIAAVGAKGDRARSVGRGSIIARAAMRSAWPHTFVRQASTIRPERFSIWAWPRKARRASLPGTLR